MDQEQEHSEVHGHEHEDVLVIPSWVPLALVGVFVGLAVVVAWDVYKQRRNARELAAELVGVSPLDMSMVEKWANKGVATAPNVATRANDFVPDPKVWGDYKAGKDEQPESPPL